MNTWITAQNLAFRYDNETVFTDIHFAVEHGGFTLIVGPNGAGKTTLLRLLAGLLTPAEGTITIAGQSPQAWQRAGGIGFVPQHYNQNTASFPATVNEVVDLGFWGTEISHAEQIKQRQAVLTKVGMAEWAHKRIGDLSGGQQQRVMLAQAIAARPALLLLDEPTSGIDYTAGNMLLDLLSNIQAEQQTTIIMVTHDIASALPHADRVLCIDRTLCYDGPPHQFVTSHATGLHMAEVVG